MLIKSNVLPRTGLKLTPLTFVTGARYAERVELVRRVLHSLRDGHLMSPVLHAVAEDPGLQPSSWQVPNRVAGSMLPHRVHYVGKHPDMQALLKTVRGDPDAISIYETLTGSSSIPGSSQVSDVEVYNLQLALHGSQVLRLDPSILVIPDAVQGKVHGSATACDRLASYLCGVAGRATLVVGANADVVEAVQAAIKRGDFDSEDYSEWNVS